MDRVPAIYIVTNKPHGTLYTGVTSQLAYRVTSHREGRGSKFARRYKLTRLVYYELHESMYAAISREKQIKGGSRRAKIGLIEALNPEWRDLFGDICS